MKLQKGQVIELRLDWLGVLKYEIQKIELSRLLKGVIIYYKRSWKGDETTVTTWEYADAFISTLMLHLPETIKIDGKCLTEN